MAYTGSRPAPTHVHAHLSDTHLIAAGGLLAGHIDTEAQLRKALARVESSGERVDALVLSGDLADSGDPAAYELLRDIVDPVVTRLGCALVLTGGNHDERRPMARTLHGIDTDAPQDTVTDCDGLRVIAIDSAVPGYHHGGFSDDQYSWLARELAAPAEHGTILVIHHAPITYRSPVMQLLDFDDVGAPRELLMGVDGPQSWNLIEVHADQVVATVVPIEQHETWPALSEAVTEFMATVPEADRREVFSRKRT